MYDIEAKFGFEHDSGNHKAAYEVQHPFDRYRHINSTEKTMTDTKPDQWDEKVEAVCEAMIEGWSSLQFEAISKLVHEAVTAGKIEAFEEAADLIRDLAPIDREWLEKKLRGKAASLRAPAKGKGER